MSRDRVHITIIVLREIIVIFLTQNETLRWGLAIRMQFINIQGDPFIKLFLILLYIIISKFFF